MFILYGHLYCTGYICENILYFCISKAIVIKFKEESNPYSVKTIQPNEFHKETAPPHNTNVHPC